MNALEYNLYTSLKEVMTWIKNWDPPFIDDPEWLDETYPKIEFTLKQAEKHG